uniref:Asp23/Gls24 family envelope stress response protein n=1 Tax=Mesoaciditoga lauensis TaxID=1495039 RepID=A0A7V3RE61_9BACT
MKFSTKYGEVEVSSQALKTLMREAIVNSYGIVDLSNASLISTVTSLFSETDRGIKLVDDGSNLKADVYVVAEYGINIPQVAFNMQDAIIYNLKTYAGIDPQEVNIHIVDVNF